MANYTVEPQPFCFGLGSLLYSLLRIILIKHHQGSPAANQNSSIETQANRTSIVKYFMQRTTQHLVFTTNFGISKCVYHTQTFSVNSFELGRLKQMLSNEMTCTNVSTLIVGLFNICILGRHLTLNNHTTHH